jgi:hypothetical protein
LALTAHECLSVYLLIHDLYLELNEGIGKEEEGRRRREERRGEL